MPAPDVPSDTTRFAERPRWQQRFLAVRRSLPRWAPDAPHRCTYATNASGVRQVWSWDAVEGRHTPITDKPTGVPWGVPTPDGAGVVWFDDTGGDEVGRYVRTPFDGGDARPLLANAPPGWSAGLSLRPDRIAVGVADGDGFSVWTSGDGGAAPLLSSRRPLSVCGLSRDAALLALSHTEHGDLLHPAVRVVDAAGDTVADADDGRGNTVHCGPWSPVAGDQRLALLADRDGRWRPEIWDVATDVRTPCAVDLPGDVEVEGWWPDATRLLLAHTHLGRRTLLAYDPADRRAVPVGPTTGTVSDATVRPDGRLWYAWQSSGRAPAVLAVDPEVGGDGVPVLPSADRVAPDGVAFSSLHYPNGDGGEVHAFLAVPDGPGPHPLVVEVHGGPAAQTGDTFDPFVQAWVDHGFAVLAPNYRGSTGYGKAWQDALEGDPGRPEVVDITAGRDHLVERGIADADRVLVTGASWGGYLTLQAIGTRPDRWSAAVAIVPVADYVAAYADESPALQEFDRGLFGGDPTQVPDLYRDRSPITHVAAVRAPVLVITGENDTRCPKRQVDNYVAALAAHDVPHHYDVYDAGHGSMAVAEQIRHQALALDFAADHLGTPTAER